MFDLDNKLYLIILSYIHYLFAESGREINFFFLIATWLLNSSKW